MDSLTCLFCLFCYYQGTKSFNELVSDPEFLVTRDSRVKTLLTKFKVREQLHLSFCPHAVLKELCVLGFNQAIKCPHFFSVSISSLNGTKPSLTRLF